MKKGILLTGVCVLAVAAGVTAGSLNSNAHFYDGSGHHYESCATGIQVVGGGHHSEHWGNAAVCWEQCRQRACDPGTSDYSEPETSASGYSEPNTPTSDHSEPVYQENYSAGNHHTKSRHGHGGSHH